SMKILDTPRVNRLGTAVAYQSRFGLCLRAYVAPRNTRTPARERMRAVFGSSSQLWSGQLTEQQRDRWSAAAATVMSRPTLNQQGPLTGQQFAQAINSVRGCVGLSAVLEPPAPVVFGPSPVGPLEITNDEDGVRLWLAVNGDLNEDVMVFGQEPCSAGRAKRRNVAYLGLLPPPIGGRSEITRLYRARYGEPRPDTKVFIVTCQTQAGWKAQDRVTSACVPERPSALQAIPSPATSQQVNMHKGSTRDAAGGGWPPVSQPQATAGRETGGGAASGAGSDGGGGGGGGGDSPPPAGS
ncbi:MAG TPA: hypothetical protein VN648_13720, partial [Candidatus Methylomirabilis sp.]|nr:hypothetical protein [Candidatus Methylomirabilis sp.]